MYAVKGLFEIDEVNCKGLLELLALFKYIPKSKDLFVAGLVEKGIYKANETAVKLFNVGPTPLTLHTLFAYLV